MRSANNGPFSSNWRELLQVVGLRGLPRRRQVHDRVARRALYVTIELMAIWRGVKITVAVTLGIAALILNPWFGATSGFDYGAPEMRAAIEGTWRLTLTPNGEPRREITFRIAQGAAASQPHASSHALVRAAAACGHRSLVRTAGACLDVSDMPLEITVLARGTPEGNVTRGEFRVMATRFVAGYLDAHIADLLISASVTPTGQAEEVTVHSVAPLGHVASLKVQWLSAKDLQPATLQRIAR